MIDPLSSPPGARSLRAVLTCAIRPWSPHSVDRLLLEEPSRDRTFHRNAARRHHARPEAEVVPGFGIDKAATAAGQDPARSRLERWRPTEQITSCTGAFLLARTRAKVEAGLSRPD